MELITCLNCGKQTDLETCGVEEDSFGTHVVCEYCGASFDVKGDSEDEHI